MIKHGQRKVVASFGVVAILAVGAVGGTFAAFSGTTENAGNYFNAGSVSLSDNDSDVAMYTVDEATPLVADESCITVTYDGNSSADVKLYINEAIDAIGPYVDLTIEAGSGTTAFDDCTGFTASGTVFTGTLASFDAAHNDFTDGLALTDPGSDGSWDTSEASDYRFTLTLQDDDAAQGLVSGTHTWTWEAQSV